MRIYYQTVSALLTQFILFVSTAAAAGVGFQEVKIFDPLDRPLQALIWYPSDEATQLQLLGGYQQIVALNGTVAGEALPLVVISHGTGGSALGHHDTAFALAEAGFVVVALTHSGDNYADKRYYATRKQLTERPRHISLAIDYMLQTWAQRGAIDGNHIGIFGFSIGGYAALVGLGGEPELSSLVEQCKALPQKWACREFGLPADLVRKFGTDPLNVIHDKRLKAAFVAAPAIPALFQPAGLRGVYEPVELWAATLDEIVPMEPDFAIVNGGLPAKPVTHIEPGARHYSFLAPCTPSQLAALREICADEPGFDRAEFHARLNAAVVAFFKEHL